MDLSEFETASKTLQEKIMNARETLVEQEREMCERFNLLEKKLQQREKDLEGEKQRFEHEKTTLSQRYQIEDIILELNVGGMHFTTFKSTLCKYENSLLSAMFSGRHNIAKDKKGRYFIDRSGEKFSTILEFLRTGRVENNEKVTEEAIASEFEYFGLQEYLFNLNQWQLQMSSHYNGFQNTKECLVVEDISKGIATGYGRNQFAKFIFDHPVPIKGVEVGPLVVPRWSCNDINDAKFQYSADNENWIDLFVIQGMNNSETKVFDFRRTVTAQYWRITKDSFVGLSYLRFF